MIALMLMYFDFFEVIIYGLILDAMYGRPGSSISAHSFFVGALLVYIIIILVKPHLRNTN